MRAERPLTILVTGAAGLIGAELCGALADRGHAVVGLFHRATVLLRGDGVAIETLDYEGGELMNGRVAIVRGDIRQAGLGLSVAARPLAARLDLVVHCAADTTLAGADDRRMATNVAGTRNLLDWLAGAKAPPRLIHVSTAYVCGARSGPIEETAPGEVFSNGYESSKAEAEHLVSASGLAVAIARPSIVVGRWSDGAISRFSNIYGLLKLVGEGRIRDLPVAEAATLDLVPLDHVVGGLVDIVEHFEAAAGRTFHLASGNPVPVAELCRFEFAGFHAPRLVAPAAEGLPNAKARRDGDFLSLYASYLTRDPRFATRNLAVLSDRICPLTDAAFVKRLIDHASAAGFLRRDPSLMPAEAVT